METQLQTEVGWIWTYTSRPWWIENIEYFEDTDLDAVDREEGVMGAETLVIV